MLSPKPLPRSARYVPPSPDQVPGAMGDLELFLHGRPAPVPILIRAALAHAQFETIHPFLDGNGRLGRLMVTLFLCGWGSCARSPVVPATRSVYAYDEYLQILSEGTEPI